MLSKNPSVSFPQIQSFKKFLLNHKASFDKLSDQHQDYMAFAIANIAEQSIENKAFDGTYCAFYKPRYAAFKKNETFLNKNSLMGEWLIKVKKGRFLGHSLGIADGWTISEEARNLYNKFVSHLNHQCLPQGHNFKGNSKPRFSNGIRQTDLSKHKSSFCDIFMPYEIEINIEEVKQFRFNHLDLSDKRSNQIVADCNFILTSLFMEEKPIVCQQYVQYPSGRLYIQGKSFQTVCREVKEAAFKGCYDYDFENCHYEIVKQLGDKYGLSTNNLTYYCNNKNLFRKQLADNNNVSVKTAKIVLLSLIYGAKLSKDRRLSIYLSLLDGSDMEESEVMLAIARMQKDPMLKEFIKELKQIRSVVFEKHKFRSDGVRFPNQVFNVFGTRIECEETPDNASIAHIIQGYEALILKVVLELHGKSLLLLQHDGFISSSPIDTDQLTQTIFQKTGFNMKLTSKML